MAILIASFLAFGFLFLAWERYVQSFPFICECGLAVIASHNITTQGACWNKYYLLQCVPGNS